MAVNSVYMSRKGWGFIRMSGSDHDGDCAAIVFDYGGCDAARDGLHRDDRAHQDPSTGGAGRDRSYRPPGGINCDPRLTTGCSASLLVRRLHRLRSDTAHTELAWADLRAYREGATHEKALKWYIKWSILAALSYDAPKRYSPTAITVLSKKWLFGKDTMRS
eukprot:5438539-Amphidinium_carterae.1